MNSNEKIIKYPLQILKMVGQHPEEDKRIFFTITALHFILSLTTLSLVFLQIVYANGNIIVVAQNCEALAVFLQVLGKSLTIAFSINDFRRLINDTKKFWAVEEGTENVKTDVQNIFEKTLKLEQLFFRAAVFTATFVMVFSYLTKELPTGIWTMKNHQFLYAFAVTIQRVIIPWVVIYTSGCEALFLSLCVYIWAQFKILRGCFGRIKMDEILTTSDEKVYLNKLYSCIKHHEFLLRFSNNLRDAYSPIMMVLYSTLVLMYFAEMYIIFESKELVILLRSFCALICILIQLSFYCVPLNYIADEAIAISEGIYNSDWHSKNIPDLKNIVPLIMQRSQKDIIFKAGGLVIMNCRTVLNVVRISYSVCTVMRAFKNV